ncbi:MAG TPA: transporter [Pusillimonas sp.]|jgi:Na+/H+ antiporter NhaD/arsenite permease-like protein|nr:transporter [Pusillimonas sp.]|tara:strand:- start:7380 stop:8630 length:1251 start_codon:yes stop_codon:yes gene_type:complete
MDITLALFILVYIAMGVGHLPGFQVDRTGAALVGAMLLIVFGRITPTQAWASIDVNTIGLLFGLMVVSAAFVVGGFYDWTARKVGGLKVGPNALLGLLIAVGGVLSALLTNDVVVVAMTPVLCAIALARRLNPVPFLLGFCFATNVGSTATLIGSPQNMIIAQALNISFTDFSSITLVPSIIGLFLIWLVLVVCYRGRWVLESASPPMASGAQPPLTSTAPLDTMETVKAGVITLALIAAFIFTDWPHMLIALAGASILLLNRKISSGDMLVHVDGNLLLLLMGLFVVNAAMAATGLPQTLLGDIKNAGIDLYAPVPMLLISGVLSNIVGNSPAVMLLAPFLSGATQTETLGAAIALGTGFSSNAIVFGSLAGIIVVEQARAQGVKISFGEFLRGGLPVTLASTLLAVGWILYLGM